MTTVDTRVIELADALRKALVTKKRDSGAEFVILRDGAPEWMNEVIHAVHSDTMPDDHIYRFIDEQANVIADSDGRRAEYLEDLLEAEGPDAYTSDLMAWASRWYEYCDEWIENNGRACIGDFIGLVSSGQALHKYEVGSVLLQQLRNKAEAEE